MVEHNPTSWYNRDILDGDYFPVARSQSSWFSFLTLTEASSFAIDTFNPDYAFQIADTLTLASMADVPALNNGDVLVYNSSITAFDAVGYELRNLRDVSLPSSIPANNVLTYNTGSQKWISSSVSGALGFTPVNKAGDTGISGNLRYNSSVVTNMSGAPADTLTTKGYVDSAVSGISGSGGALSVHMADLNAHGASASTIPGRIAQRTGGTFNVAGQGLVLGGTTDWDGVTTPSKANTSSQGFHLLNAAWMSANSSVLATPNTYIQRNSNGRAQITTPGVSTEIANKYYVDLHGNDTSGNVHGATSSATANSIMRRDSSGRVMVAPPIAGDNSTRVPTTSWVRSLIGGSTGITGSGTNSNSMNNAGYIRVGDFAFVWSALTQVGDGSDKHMYGPDLPSGTKYIQAAWGAPYANQGAVLDWTVGIGQNTASFSGNKPHITYDAWRGENRGTSVISVRIFWIVKWA